MKISYNWLKEFVEFNETPDELAQLLTFIGLETTVISSQSISSDDIVSAKVIDVCIHPNADKLKLCTLTDGRSNFSVVCGAANVLAGQIVPLALLGAELPGGIKIKKTKIRGVESEGMICSEKELGLKEDADGILVLENGTPLGRPIKEIIGDSDTIIEVEITTNRPDCLSHWGVAREIAAKLRKKINFPDITRHSSGKDINILIKDVELCQRYIGSVITGVKVAASPEWISKKLVKCGIKPINNIVDITNYVLLELGHPMHAFDFKKLAGGKLIVRRAENSERIAALDNNEYKLDDSMLVVADEVKPQALAGIIGSKESCVDENTETILLESAIFSAGSVRKTSKKLNITTDASYRFERGTAWEVSDLASWRAINLIEKIAGGKAHSVQDITEINYESTKILIRPERVKKVLALDLSIDEIRSILESLGLVVKDIDENLEVAIPSWRLDLKKEIDLIEEIARLKGYENIPVSILPVMPDSEKINETETVDSILRTRLEGLGFCEALNYSFVDEKQLEYLKLKSNVKVSNPLSKENEFLRPNILPGLWRNLTLNLGQGFNTVKLFETGTVFKEKGENKSIGILVFGPAMNNWWGWESNRIKNPDLDFYFLHGIISNLFSGNKYKISRSEITSNFYHPFKNASIEISGKHVGEIGILLPDYSINKKEVGYAEFDLTVLENIWNRRTPKYEQLKRFPSAKRDLSVIADKSMSFEDITNTLSEFKKKNSLLENYELFSVFENPKLGENKISYSLHFTLRHLDHTLTDKEVNLELAKILKIFEEKKILLRS